MNGHRERLAWAMVLGSFFICIGLTIAFPLGIRAIIQRATRSLDVLVQANQGTVGVRQSDSEPVALFAGDVPVSLNPSGSILTNATDTALLLIQDPGNEQLVARLQVYGNTNVSLNSARTPRFRASSVENVVIFDLDNGRVHLTIPPDGSRPLSVEVDTPQGKVSFQEEGQYSVIASNSETQMAVLQGKGKAEQGEESLVLATDQRVVMPSGGSLVGPLDSERNLITNGDFKQGYDSWVILAPNVEITTQPPVEVILEGDGEEPAISFKRLGIGHADAGIRQIINHDVTDFDSLQLVLSMNVIEQSLSVCGQQGSECPLIVRIEYTDANGVDQIWQQGFYAVGEISNETPDVCIACPPPLNVHQRVPYQQLVFYESENLLDNLQQLGIPPARIKSITIIASGHSFDTQVIDIALMAKE